VLDLASAILPEVSILTSPKHIPKVPQEAAKHTKEPQAEVDEQETKV
jgi:hypothetical protein